MGSKHNENRVEFKSRINRQSKVKYAIRFYYERFPASIERENLCWKKIIEKLTFFIKCYFRKKACSFDNIPTFFQ